VRPSSYHFYLDLGSQRESGYADRRPRGIRFLELTLVDLIHSRKVLHIRQEHVDFDHIVRTETRCVEDREKILEA
jgi:hypothetical protein